MNGLPLAVFDQIANQPAARGASSGRERQANAQADPRQTPFDAIMAKLANAALPPVSGQAVPAPQPPATPVAPRPVVMFPAAAPDPATQAASDETSAALLDAMNAKRDQPADPPDARTARPARQKRDANLPDAAPAQAGAGLDTAQAAVASALQAFTSAHPDQNGSGPGHAQEVLGQVTGPGDGSALQQMLDAQASATSGSEGHSEKASRLAGGDTLPQRQSVSNSDIKKVSFETHLLPGSPQPPALQVADAVISDLKETQAAAAATPVEQPQAPQPVRILHIALEPVGLGHVSVHLRMVDGHLDLELRSAGHDALRMIDADKDALAASLTNAGYSLDRLVTSVAADHAGSATTGQGGSSVPFEQNGGQDRTSNGERQSQSGRQQTSQNESGNGYESQSNRGASRGARDLYL